jgi:hemoglobin/transferrin/lactoferrin receptor protein
VRGLKGSEVLHLVDGMRLNTAFFRNSPNQYMALIDPFNIERIEIVRGPMSVLYGSDAMGGVVQIITPTARFDGPEWQQSSGLRTQLASADDSSLTRVHYAAGHAGFSYSLGASYQNVGDLQTADRTVPFTNFSARGFDGKVLAALGDTRDLMVNVQYWKQPKTPRVDELVPGFGQTVPTSSEFLFKPQARTFLHTRYSDQLDALVADRLEVHWAYQGLKDDRQSRALNATIREFEDNQSEMHAVTVQLDKRLNEATSLVYGADAHYDLIESRRSRIDLRNGAVSFPTTRFPNKSRMNTYGAYAEGTFQATERFSLTAGGRASRVWVNLPVADRGVATDLRFNDFTYAFGALYALNDHVNLVSNLGRGFRAPNVFDLGTLGARPNNRFNIPNPALDPEKVVSLDAGVKLRAARFNGELIGYVSRFRDKLSVVETGVTRPDRRVEVQTRNIARQTIRGIEASGHFVATDALSLNATLTWTRGNEQVPGTAEVPADRIPPLNGRLGALWQIRDNLSLEGYAYYATRQDRLSPRDRIDPRVNPNGTAGYATSNVALNWRINDHHALSVRAENLSDQAHRQHGSGIDEAGRNLIVDWRVDF